MEDITELPEEFRPPEWLTDVIPRKSPYVPQMGDNVMYFKQGHELYLQAVKKRNVYKVDTRKHQPWHSNPNLRVRPCIVFQFTVLLLYIRLVAVWLWKYFGLFIYPVPEQLNIFLQTVSYKPNIIRVYCLSKSKVLCRLTHIRKREQGIEGHNAILLCTFLY